eukprot:TRINITY_DN86184_c0_g1_i1.p1 TRINITY_DN86184_c0_g1~~TRINITY_DN86184_c0_g1_i1.p1  ORF type:complete len:162 (+),score=12.00 TRINITY_DN86184_c0_g1_i1:27-512(+)
MTRATHGTQTSIRYNAEVPLPSAPGGSQRSANHACLASQIPAAAVFTLLFWEGCALTSPAHVFADPDDDDGDDEEGMKAPAKKSAALRVPLSTTGGDRRSTQKRLPARVRRPLALQPANAVGQPAESVISSVLRGPSSACISPYILFSRALLEHKLPTSGH